MTGLTEQELVARSGVAAERVRRFVELGVLEPGPDGFRPPDIQLARTYRALDDAGISAEQIATLMNAGAWSNAWADLIFPDPAAFSEHQLGRLATELDLPQAFVDRLYAAWQLPRPGPTDPMREDEAELLRIAAVIYHGVGGNADAAIAAARTFGDSMRRVAESQVRFFRAHVEEPMYAAGVPMRQAIDSVSAIARPFMDESEKGMRLLHSRHMEHYIVEDVIANLELSLAQAGLGQPRPKRPPAIAFLDLTGYTSLTEHEGDEVAAKLAENLAEMVQAAASQAGGQVVKLLGDGVMFHFAEPAGAIICGLTLVEESPALGLPQARIGVNSGPVIFRDGDYFGRTVNVAARVTDYARPAEVLVTVDAVVEPPPDGVEFSEIGDVGLKGVAAPVRLFQAKRT
jgi:adenylate cyclase